MVKVVLSVLFWVVVAFADEIEEEIVKNLDFFMNMEVLEDEDLARNWKVYADDKDRESREAKDENYN